ncbi:hypothetical protein Sjap_006693 [Stephania japonica]|uniref:Uncharacterized protein n=1 Tax=Stephania japonica TaxID=461633 RepID=A0AAP0K8X2_9MAGN
MNRGTFGSATLFVYYFLALLFMAVSAFTPKNPQQHQNKYKRNNKSWKQHHPSSWDQIKSLLTCKQVEIEFPSTKASVIGYSKLGSSCNSICSFRDVVHTNTRVVHRADNSPESSTVGIQQTGLLTRKPLNNYSNKPSSSTNGVGGCQARRPIQKQCNSEDSLGAMSATPLSTTQVILLQEQQSAFAHNVVRSSQKLKAWTFTNPSNMPFQSREQRTRRQHSGDHLQIKLDEDRESNLQDQTDIKGPQQPTHDPTVRGVQGRGEGTCKRQRQEEPQVRRRRERAAQIPLHLANVRAGRTSLV